jgi:hypothetical protein
MTREIVTPARLADQLRAPHLLFPRPANCPARVSAAAHREWKARWSPVEYTPS